MSELAKVEKPRVVIVGAGFGGIEAAKCFVGKNVQVTVIDRNNFHLFQPLLYQVSTSVLTESEIAYPIRNFFSDCPNIDFYWGEVVDFDAANKAVITQHGAVSYDYLIMAAGATTNFFGMKSVEDNSFTMKTLDDATKIRNHVLTMVEAADKEPDINKRRQLLTFVCVGGGPTGVEEAGALAELIFDVLPKEYHNLAIRAEADVKLIEAMDSVLAMVPQSLRNITVEVLRKKRVDVRLNTQVMDYDGEVLTFKNGESVPTKTVIWAAGVKAVPVTAKMDAELDRSGRVIVNEYLQVPKHSGVYAIGDMAHFVQDGQPLATIAPVAMQQAKIAAGNILREMDGRTALSFRYEDVGAMATIGRGEAVMCRGSMKNSGFIAWAGWMVVHLVRLAGFHSNITVAWKWLWNLLLGTRLSRIITHRE